MLKPYYPKLMYVNSAGGNDSVYVKQQKYSKADSSQFLNTNTILGSAKWSKGLSEIAFTSGIYLETSIVILPQKPKLFIESIALGFKASIYESILPIMADQKAQNWNVQLFAELSFGETW